MVNVLLVDDHALVRLGIRKLLDGESGIKVVGEASSGEEAIKLSRETNAHVVLMDVRMPGIGGLEATRKLLRLNPDLKIVALTSYDDDLFPTRFIQAGAAGYLTKDSTIDEMVRAIKVVNSGQRYISPEVAQKMAIKQITDPEQSPFDQLSERELQVALMVTSMQKVAVIADKLHLSPKTVNSYRYRIFDKLGISSDVELTHLAIRHGLVEQHNLENED
ncbi:MAG: two-component system response regulator UvrY [Legionellales bacterium]|nr:two-component system response regulator UvrY [Legionellales bacterium]